METLTRFLGSVAVTARSYGVDPLVFTVIFASSIPIFWAGMALVGRSGLSASKPLTGSRRRDFGLGLAVCITAWAAPYVYVALWGHSLPWWLWVALVLALIPSGRSVWRRARRPLDPGAAS